MSWDFGLEPYCSTCMNKAEPLRDYYDANYTYNVSHMFYDAMGGDGIRQIHGMRCRDARPVLDRGIEAMSKDPHKYQGMNPPNGWGNYEGALALLRKLRDWCDAEPDAFFNVS